MTGGGFSFFVGHPPLPILPGEPQWLAALPLDGRSEVNPTPLSADQPLTYGDYFTAATQFLAQDGMAIIRRAAAQLFNRTISPAQVNGIRIHLAKHGAFYHPAKVLVEIGPRLLALVLNVAVSEQGRTTLATEYDALQRLNRLGRPWLPRVVGRGGERLAGAVLEMFAAEWLEGFCEFHLSRAPDSSFEWRVWGERGERLELPAPLVADLYRQSACILTACFDPFTFEAILGWHHAAGDFIVKPEHDHLTVRLITVRRYGPLFAATPAETPGLETLLEALAAFFVNLSLHMRLDRLDGVGELVWAPDEVLPAIWGGFADGLQEMAAAHGLPPEFGPAVRQYLSAHPPQALAALGQRIAQRYSPSSGERRLIEAHLDDHLRALDRIMDSDF